MPKQRVDIIYLSGRVKKESILKRYENGVLDTSFKPNMNKAAIYVRLHEPILKSESQEGTLYLLGSKKFDTDRKKAKELFKAILKEYRLTGEVVEYRQVAQLTVKEFSTIQNPDSLHELSKPIVFKKDENLQLYAQGTLLILSKLKRMALIDSKEYRDELKILTKLVSSVAEKI